MTLSLDTLLRLRPDLARPWARSRNIGVWAEDTFGYANAPFHWEWYKLLHTQSRLCLVSPRDSAKSEVVTINQTAWRSLYQPGTWTYIFAATSDLAMELKSRVDDAVWTAESQQLDAAQVQQKKETIYANGSRVSCAGAGVAVRGQHPDVIIGDDVLEESTTLTEYQRNKTNRWWHGTVGGMAHPRTWRQVNGRRHEFPGTKIFLVGTPFAQNDLLMSMRLNPRYTFRRYSSEPGVFADGWAVEFTGEPVGSKTGELV